MHQKLDSTTKAEMLTCQLNGDIAALDGNVVTANPNVLTTPTTSPNGWDEPLPLETTASTPPFPIHCLPEVMRYYALAVSEDTQTSIDMSAVAAIGTASACLQGKYMVQGKSGYIVPLNNYISVIAKPSERKSSICAIFEEPLKAYEKQENEARALDIAQSTNIRQVLEKELEALKNAAVKVKKRKGGGDTGGQNEGVANDTADTATNTDNHVNQYAEIEAKQAELLSHEDIKPLRLVCGSDISPEALTSLLADNNGRMAMFSAEGGIFDILGGMYSNSANIDTFLKAHCGDSIRVDRDLSTLF